MQGVFGAGRHGCSGVAVEARLWRSDRLESGVQRFPEPASPWICSAARIALCDRSNAAEGTRLKIPEAAYFLKPAAERETSHAFCHSGT